MEAKWPFDYHEKKTPALLRALRPQPARASCTIDDSSMLVRFGRFAISTPISNIRSADVTGPYSWWRVAGGPRLSLKDHGITLATSTSAGVCIRFKEPVGPIVRGLPKHPGLTMTVIDPESLVGYISALQATIR